MLAVEPRRVPHPDRLETEALLLPHAVEVAANHSTSEADRLMASAREGRKHGSVLSLAWSHKGESERASLRADLAEHAGRSWMLLLLEGGEEVVLDLGLQAMRSPKLQPVRLLRV